MSSRKVPAKSPSVASRQAPKTSGGDAERRAAVILEVLAGVRTVAEAAQTLGICANHYYLLERKALAGLVAACQPQPKGQRSDPDKELATLRRALERSQRECQRQAALVRATQRALNLPAAPAERPANGKAKGKPPRKRARSVRALRAARTLGENVAKTKGSEVQPGKEASDNGVSDVAGPVTPSDRGVSCEQEVRHGT